MGAEGLSGGHRLRQPLDGPALRRARPRIPRAARPGDARCAKARSARVIGALESRDALKALIKKNDWNQVHIIARGNTLIHIVNGHVISVVVDDDPKGRAMSGLLGFQIHVGPPMKVEFRNIWLKTL